MGLDVSLTDRERVQRPPELGHAVALDYPAGWQLPPTPTALNGIERRAWINCPCSVTLI
jgi:hypothetical protein